MMTCAAAEGELNMTLHHSTSLLIVLASILLGVIAIPAPQAGEWAPYESQGTVVQVMPEQGFILLNHEPIRAPGFLMGQMEMPFSVENPALLNDLKPGDRVQFRVSAEKKSRIIELKKLP
jgi:Cu/Ag efflux protein CusF